MVELINAPSLTREGATQTAQNEVVLNAAYINGDWIEIEAPTTDSDNTDFDNINNHALYDPNSGEVIATTRLCISAHVETAVRAASEAYSSWSQTDVNERARYLSAIAAYMEQQFECRKYHRFPHSSIGHRLRV